MLFFRLDLALAMVEWFGMYKLMIPASSNKMTSSNGLPRVRLPQGTYEGSISEPSPSSAQASARKAIALGVGKGDANLPPPPSYVPKTLDVFLGVPYAQSTAGNNRFRKPVPLAVTTESAAVVHNATAKGQYCPGSAAFLGVGEECLNANIYRPIGVTGGAEDGRTTATRLPVAVYVHGGGFNSGLGTERNMGDFCRYAAVDMVCVSFNYRVGALGFLGWTPNATDYTTDREFAAAQAEAPLNIGLHDQQAAFAWVRDNIAYFGGDPNNVTIMGLSAGAHSIGHHLVYYPKGKAPFQKAILESGATTARAVWSPGHFRPKEQLKQFLTKAGILGSDSDITNQTDASIPDLLRQLPLGTVIDATRAVWNAYGPSVAWPFQPLVDGDIIPRNPIESWRTNVFTHVPVLTGFDTNEGASFVPSSKARADTDEQFRAFFKTLLPAATETDLDTLSDLYPDPVTRPDESPYVMDTLPAGISGRQWLRLDAAYAHFAYICPVLQTAHFLSNTSSYPNQQIYVYQFAATSSRWNTANHGDNAPVVAHNDPTLEGHPGLLAVSNEMHGAWVRFAASPDGDPNYNIANLNSSSLDDQQATDFVRWEPFVSPFNASSTNEVDAKRKRDTAADLTTGQLIVYGKGNDERVPAENRVGGTDAKPGTPAQLRTLTDFEKQQCAFWWSRIELSEGLGKLDTVASATAATATATKTARITSKL